MLINYDEDDREALISKPNKLISSELKSNDIEKDYYSIDMNKDAIKDSVSNSMTTFHQRFDLNLTKHFLLFLLGQL